MIPDLVYLKNIALGEENKKIETELKAKEERNKITRNDLFVIKNLYAKTGQEIILNENKLASIYK